MGNKVVECGGTSSWRVGDEVAEGRRRSRGGCGGGRGYIVRQQRCVQCIAIAFGLCRAQIKQARKLLSKVACTRIVFHCSRWTRQRSDYVRLRCCHPSHSVPVLYKNALIAKALRDEIVEGSTAAESPLRRPDGGGPDPGSSFKEVDTRRLPVIVTKRGYHCSNGDGHGS